jgi:hypothetical protein
MQTGAHVEPFQGNIGGIYVLGFESRPWRAHLILDLVLYLGPDLVPGMLPGAAPGLGPNLVGRHNKHLNLHISTNLAPEASYPLQTPIVGLPF